MRNKNIKNGFGIMEVLIAASLLIIIVGSVVGLSRMTLKNNMLSSEKIQAYNLVREGLEIIRSLRDTNWIDVSPESTWLDNICNPTIDQNEAQCTFVYNDILNKYVISNNVPEKISINNIEFERVYKVSITKKQNLADFVDEQYKNSILVYNTRIVEVEVSWKNTGKKYSVKGSTFLTNWKPEI